MDRVSHDGLQDVQFSRKFSFQEIELGNGEVVGMEVRGAPEARAAGRRALGIDVLSWLEKSINQVSYKLVVSGGVSRPAVVDDCGGERVQGHSIRDVQEQPQQESHDHSHGHGGLQNAYHEDA